MAGRNVQQYLKFEDGRTRTVRDLRAHFFAAAPGQAVRPGHSTELLTR